MGKLQSDIRKSSSCSDFKLVWENKSSDSILGRVRESEVSVAFELCHDSVVGEAVEGKSFSLVSFFIKDVDLGLVSVFIMRPSKGPAE